MAHFAKLEDGIVTDVIVVDNCVCDGLEQEQAGIDFCNNLVSGEWVQTSYNGSFRNRFARIGGSYLKDIDAFINPKPYESWTLDCAEWKAPIDKPDGDYYWDEETLSWVESEVI